eukprot:4905148-Pyramimonas_sp.AAC.3
MILYDIILVTGWGRSGWLALRSAPPPRAIGRAPTGICPVPSRGWSLWEYPPQVPEVVSGFKDSQERLIILGYNATLSTAVEPQRKRHFDNQKNMSQGPRGEQREKVGNWTQGEKRGRVSRVLSAPLPLSAQEDP